MRNRSPKPARDFLSLGRRMLRSKVFGPAMLVLVVVVLSMAPLIAISGTRTMESTDSADHQSGLAGDSTGSGDAADMPLSLGSAEFWLAVIGLLLVAIAAVSLFRMLAGVDPDATDRARQRSHDPYAVALLTRWFRRSRHFRQVGGLVGVIVAMSFVDGDLTPAIIGGVVGVTVGGAVAEVHSFRRGRYRPNANPDDDAGDGHYRDTTSTTETAMTVTPSRLTMTVTPTASTRHEPLSSSGASFAPTPTPSIWGR